MSDIFYNPEELGLEIVAVMEDEPDYDFNMVVVWKDKNDKYYWGHDAGCSCPSPFEDYYDASSLNKLNKQTFRDFEQTVRDQLDSYNLAKNSEKVADIRKLIWK